MGVLTKVTEIKANYGGDQNDRVNRNRVTEPGSRVKQELP